MEAEPTTGAPTPNATGRVHRVLVDELADRVGDRREATWIVEHVERSGESDPAAVAATARALAERRVAGEPLQYVLGSWAFRSLELAVDRRVLIPRPETEQVVEVALGELDRITRGRRPDAGRPVCVDLGTGSGAGALSLALEGGRAGAPPEVWATDCSTDALDVARANLAAVAARHPEVAARITLRAGSWFDALPDHLAHRVDLIVSNPPYVTEEEYPDLDPGVREWEPEGALVAGRGASGVGGTSDIEAVVAGAGHWLQPSGALVVELAPAQADAVAHAARRAGFSRVGTAPDLTGRTRMLVAER